MMDVPGLSDEPMHDDDRVRQDNERTNGLGVAFGVVRSPTCRVPSYKVHPWY